jgi:hypothetical protein
MNLPWHSQTVGCILWHMLVLVYPSALKWGVDTYLCFIQKSLQLGREYTNIRYSSEVQTAAGVSDTARGGGLTLTLSRSTTSLPTTPSSAGTRDNKRGPSRASSDAHLPRWECCLHIYKHSLVLLYKAWTERGLYILYMFHKFVNM